MMTVTRRGIAKSVRSKSKQSGTMTTMHLAAGGSIPSRSRSGADIALAPGIFNDVLSRKAAATGLLNGFGKAVRDAKRSGRMVRMTVLVDPERVSPEIAMEEVREQHDDELSVTLGEAHARGAQRAAEILNGPEMLTADQFAATIGATRETVHQKRRRHDVLGLEGAKRGVRFPRWQVSADGALLPGLPRLFSALGGHSWAVHRFLLQHHPELDGATALDALRRGRVEAVIDAAENVAQGVFA